MPGGKWQTESERPVSSANFLQFEFPQPQAPSVAAATVRSDDNLIGCGIELSSFKAPPATNGGHGKGTRVMVGAHVDKSGVAPQVIDAIGIGARHFRSRKIMAADLAGLFARQPLLPRVIVVSNQFLFLGVNGNDRPAVGQALFDAYADVAELRVPVRMIGTLFGLAVALQTEMLVMQDLGDFDITDRMPLLG